MERVTLGDASPKDLHPFSGYERPDTEAAIRRRLSALGQWTTSYACQIIREGVDATKEERDCMVHVFYEWLHYWTANAPYVNEVRWIEIPPLPGMTADDLTRDGYRRVPESTATLMCDQMCCLFFLSSFTSSTTTNSNNEWSLERTTCQWWIDDWSQLQCDEADLEVTESALDKMRTENDEKKRAETTDGPGQMKHDDDDKPKLTTEQIFHAALQRVHIGNVEQKRDDDERPVFREKMLWFRPVSMYSQSDVYESVMLFVERINDYPVHDETFSFIYALTARMGALSLQPSDAGVFNMPRFRDDIRDDGTLFRCNRSWLNWSACYMYELLQRAHYWRHIGKHRVDPLHIDDNADESRVVNLQRFVVHLCRDMGAGDFKKLFRLSCDEYFAFPGDNMYSRFLHPEGVLNRGDVLSELRPDRQAVRYFGAQRYSTETIVQGVLNGESHLFRITLFNILDRFFHVESSISWRDGCVVDQSGLHGSQYKLIQWDGPAIVFLFSRPYVHYKRRIVYVENVWDTVIQWACMTLKYNNGTWHHKKIKKQLKQLLGLDNSTQRVLATEIQNQDPEIREADATTTTTSYWVSSDGQCIIKPL